jgi:hypothetical protein
MPLLERLNELLEVVEIPPDKYGVWSGLVWKVERKGTRGIGSVAGSQRLNPNNPDRLDWVVGVEGVNYLTSRVVYYMTYGEDPGDTQVDHEDQNWLNNNTWNLRLAIGPSAQQINSPTRRNNTSGVPGVWWNKATGKWRAQVRGNHKGRNLGYFTCKVEAARAVRDKWIELGWDKLGRKLPNLDKVECGCHHCAPHNF